MDYYVIRVVGDKSAVSAVHPDYFLAVGIAEKMAENDGTKGVKYVVAKPAYEVVRCAGGLSKFLI